MAESLSQLLARHLGRAESGKALGLGSGGATDAVRGWASQRRGWTCEAADLEAGPDVQHALLDPYRWASLGNRSFQVVVACGFLERIPFFWLAWKEIIRVLADGGVVVLGASAADRNGYFRLGPGGFSALADLGSVELQEAIQTDDGSQEALAVFRKTAAPSPETLAVPAPLGAPPAATPLVRDPGYARRLGLSVAEWMIYHHEKVVFDQVSWMGVPALKNPLDCWIYQEILWEVKPEVVVEIGGLAGGGALFLSHMLDLIGGGSVISLERDRTHFRARHPRLEEVTGDAADPAVRAAVEARCAGKRTLIIHDADHTAEAVLRDLRSYAGLVSPGSYFIVEDGVVELFDSRLAPRLGWDSPGPMTAVRRFLEEDHRFAIDFSRERYLATYNPCGFLKRAG